MSIEEKFFKDLDERFAYTTDEGFVYKILLEDSLIRDIPKEITLSAIFTHIHVNLGWELISTHTNEYGLPVHTFRKIQK